MRLDDGDIEFQSNEDETGAAKGFRDDKKVDET
jgi:hypothetical protein